MPIEIEWNITTKCNLFYPYYMDGFLPRDECSLEDAKKILDNHWSSGGNNACSL
ncbi:MAG: hypothetical protein L6408_00365 [Nanoarchaeota archaeon]|nr:hypothetical protein [Nanoarchaeota archaeon]